jgi:hypothetical protein
MVEARREEKLARRFGASGFALVSVATLLAIAVDGYHPYAEDGGLYLARLLLLLDPRLYPHETAFAMGRARWSIFSPMVAGLTRMTHLPLMVVVATLHVASVWALLYAAWMLAARCFAGQGARAGAASLLACWLGVPVAGTALYVMDPYLTGRSFALAAMMFAIVGALDATEAGPENSARRSRGWMACAMALLACATMHLLMAMYAAAAVAALACVRAKSSAMRVGGTAALCLSVVVAAACAQMLAPAESAALLRAELTRSYWFLSEWRWYEVVGLAAPLGILGGVGWSEKVQSYISPEHEAIGPVKNLADLARMAVVTGLLACVVALLFAHENAAAHLVARMQPLRMFQTVYVVMIVMLGGWMGERVLKRPVWRWIAAAAVLGGIMFNVNRELYASSDHLELPSITPRNQWEQAFLWARANTPKDVLFAMDADYNDARGEDAQGFRALAQRSALPDRSKDGGEAAIAPELAEAWARGVAAQEGLNTTSDAVRVARLKPLGVTWVVLEAGAKTEFVCPFANARVKVCRLP